MGKELKRAQSVIIGGLLLTTVALASVYPTPPVITAAPQLETRCGWLSNPTPANMWLFDRDGQWIIGMQGGYQMEGDDWDIPDFKPEQWVPAEVGSYGYGCACLRLRVNRETHEVLEIKGSRARPLSACRRDRSLRRWGFK